MTTLIDCPFERSVQRCFAEPDNDDQQVHHQKYHAQQFTTTQICLQELEADHKYSLQILYPRLLHTMVHDAPQF